ncbi:hypothetical protein [Rhodopila sp.]|uniref:hypothetical protein n=1 Tax=Rhodopila sp. TaxID=2480087 RepID=UPI003D0BFCBF
MRDVLVASERDLILSRIIRLRLTYSGIAPVAPASVILKTAVPARIDGAWQGGRQEVAFYTRIAPSLPARLVPGCFEAHYDEAKHGWHLLLEDLTDSHILPTQWPLPPTRTQCEAILTALARFHATWWDDPRLGTSVGSWFDVAAMDRRTKWSAEQFTRFADRLGDDLPPARRDLYQRLFRAAPRLHRRYHSHRNMTIGHGDAHVWNCLLPRDGGDDVRLLDWDGWRVNVPTNDLAYMMAVHWYPDRRHRLERTLLDHYHAVLLAHGVSGYDRHDLDEDYRLSVLWQMITPVWQAANNIPPMIWWSHLQRILLAVDDLHCRDLLE